MKLHLWRICYDRGVKQGSPLALCLIGNFVTFAAFPSLVCVEVVVAHVIRSSCASRVSQELQWHVHRYGTCALALLHVSSSRVSARRERERERPSHARPSA